MLSPDHWGLNGIGARHRNNSPMQKAKETVPRAKRPVPVCTQSDAAVIRRAGRKPAQREFFRAVTPILTNILGHIDVANPRLTW
jgi:hypothetical protein